MEWSQDGSGTSLCPGYQATNKDGSHSLVLLGFFGKLFVWNYWASCNQTVIKWYFADPLPIFGPEFLPRSINGYNKDLYGFLFRLSDISFRDPMVELFNLKCCELFHILDFSLQSK